MLGGHAPRFTPLDVHAPGTANTSLFLLIRDEYGPPLTPKRHEACVFLNQPAAGFVSNCGGGSCVNFSCFSCYSFRFSPSPP